MRRLALLSCEAHLEATAHQLAAVLICDRADVERDVESASSGVLQGAAAVASATS